MTQLTPGTTTAVTNVGTFAVQAAQSGTWNITNISGAISLPTGASTSAKQPALGIAGTASADVITVQGITSMTPLKVDGSGVTQPISGTVTANAGTNLNTSALALETGGNLASILGRFPATQTIGDTMANPTVSGIGSYLLGYNGSQWGALRAGYTTAQTGQPFLNTLSMGKYTATGVTLTNGQQVVMQMDSAANLLVNVNSALPAGTNVIGHVIVDSAPTTAVTGTFWQATQPVSGTVSITANSAVNVAQINGVTPLMGNGTTGTGSLRVSLASDSSISGISTSTKQSDGSQKTQIVDGAGNVVGSTTNALDINIKSGSIANTTFTVVGSAMTNVTSTAYEASHVIKNAPGTLYGLSGYNSKSSAQFILLFNSTTVPVDTTAAVYVITIPAQSNFSVDFGVYGRPFSIGIVVSNSSTSPTKTIGSADCFFDAQII